MSTQTVIQLPHTQRDVLWTASTLDPVVDTSEEPEDSDELEIGSRVHNIDNVDTV